MEFVEQRAKRKVLARANYMWLSGRVSLTSPARLGLLTHVLSLVTSSKGHPMHGGIEYPKHKSCGQQLPKGRPDHSRIGYFSQYLTRSVAFPVVPREFSP